MTFRCIAHPVAASVFLAATSALTFACIAHPVAASVFLAATSALTFRCFAQSVAVSVLMRNRFVLWVTDISAIAHPYICVCSTTCI
ncbi:MAG: hypothetical protein ACR9NN_00910 [Nostochopsis sp.]